MKLLVFIHSACPYTLECSQKLQTYYNIPFFCLVMEPLKIFSYRSKCKCMGYRPTACMLSINPLFETSTHFGTGGNIESQKHEYGWQELKCSSNCELKSAVVYKWSSVLPWRKRCFPQKQWLCVSITITSSIFSYCIIQSECNFDWRWHRGSLMCGW